MPDYIEVNLDWKIRAFKLIQKLRYDLHLHRDLADYYETLLEKEDIGEELGTNVVTTLGLVTQVKDGIADCTGLSSVAYGQVCAFLKKEEIFDNNLLITDEIRLITISFKSANNFVV